MAEHTNLPNKMFCFEIVVGSVVEKLAVEDEVLEGMKFVSCIEELPAF